MTPLLIIIAAVIVAAPFVFWFLWRRARPRADRERPEGLAATSALNADHFNTATLEVAHPPDSLASVEANETPGKAPKEMPEEEPPPAFDAASSAQSLSEQDTSTQQNRGSHRSEGDNDAKTIAGDQTASSEQIPQAHTEIFPESKAPAADIGTPGTSDQQHPETPIILPAALGFTPAHRRQAERTAQGTEVSLTATQYPNEELTQPNAGAEQAQPPHDMEESVDGDSEKAPQRYRPPPQRPPRQEAPAKPVNRAPERAGRPSEVELEIRVRLKFDRFGLCEIGLLPERTPELDNEVAVRSGGISLHLVAQEDWYEDLQFEKIGDHLRQGIELKGRLANHRRARWLLTGRDVYVLASHQRASGFVSTNRLVLGRSHVVLCVAGILQQVEAILPNG